MKFSLKTIYIVICSLVVVDFCKVIVLIKPKGEVCMNNLDCPNFNICNEENKCIHKNVFPIETQEIIGLLFLLIGSAISNAGGVGGGALLIPILIVILNFDTQEAIPLSHLMIFAGAIASYFLGFKVKHPHRDAITIDYNIALIKIPLLLFGTMFGVTLNQIFPKTIILILLTIVLVINTWKTFKM